MEIPGADFPRWKLAGEDVRVPQILDWILGVQAAVRQASPVQSRIMSDFKATLKPQAEKLVEMLNELVQLRVPYCIRQRIGECFGAIFQIVGTTLLSGVMANVCDIVRTKEDVALINVRL